jgi:hypothetical protein
MDTLSDPVATEPEPPLTEAGQAARPREPCNRVQMEIYVVLWHLPKSVRAVGVCLVIFRDRLFRDAAIAGELESGAERPAPDFGCAGLPPRTGDLGARLPRPGDPDGLADELGGPPRPLHGEVVEHGEGKLVHWPAWTLALQRAHGLGELFQAEDTGRVIEQAYRGARRHPFTVTGRRTSRLGNIHLFLPCPAVGRTYDLVSCPLVG